MFSVEKFAAFLNKKDPYCLFHSLVGFKRIESNFANMPHNHFKHTTREARALCRQYCKRVKCHPRKFQGITLDKLGACEELFGVGIQVFGMQFMGNNRKHRFYTVRAASMHKNKKMNLLLHDNHFVLIKDVSRICGLYECSHCYHISNRIDNGTRHQKSCTGTRQVMYKSGLFQPRISIVKQLAEIGVEIDDPTEFQDKSIIVYDAEVELKQLESFDRNTDNLQFSEKHIPISIAVASNVPGFDTSKFFYNPEDCSTLVEDFIAYALQISFRAQEIMRKQLDYVFEQLESLSTNAEQSGNKQLFQRLKSMEQKFEAFVSRTPVVGFNSSRYDLRALKHVFFSVLNRLDGIKFCVKKDGAYLCVASENLRFVDIAKFLGPGPGGLDTYLKSYGNGMSGNKMVFPYKYLSNPADLINQKKLPPYASFESELAGGNLFEINEQGDQQRKRKAGREKYKQLRFEWKSGKWGNLLEYLEAYNCNDVLPLVQAIENHQTFFFGKEILMLREYTTLPSLCLPYLFSFAPPEDNFILLDGETNQLFRNNLFGGLAVITTRYAEVGITKIKEHIYGNEGELCELIQSLDANLLYTGCLGQDMFTGPYVIRCEEDGFRPRIANKGSFTIQFLQFTATKNNEHIRHALSEGGEYSTFIDGHLAYADGFIEANEKRPQPLWIEINTCGTHGCPKCFRDRCAVSSLNGKTYDQIYEESENRLQKIRRKYQVKVYWECDLKQYYRESDEFRHFCNNISLAGPRISRRRMTEDDILDEISTGALFGAVLCSVSVPKSKRAEFDQFPPIICRKTVSTECCGDVMKKIAEEMSLGKIQREQLVGCFDATDILFSTSMLSWYLKHGIRIFDIKKVIQFTRKQPFKSFTDEIAMMRKTADEDDNVMLSTTAKALGNSSYGFTLYSPTRGNDTKFVNQTAAPNFVRSNRFQSLEELSEGMAEVNLEKSKVTEYLPVHIGFQVYALSKLHMQRFVHDVLRSTLSENMWEILGSDTDSVIIAMSKQSLDECVKPGSKKKWLRLKKKYFVDSSNPESLRETSRTPLLFKEEIAKADIFLAPSAKCYFAGVRTGDGSFETVKTSAKGVSKKQNLLTESMYREAVFGTPGGNGKQTFEFQDVKNLGFRMIGSSMYSYSQTKHGLSPIYIKREVLPNLYSTKTIENFN